MDQAMESVVLLTTIVGCADCSYRAPR